jgi:hypothetical protein
MAELDDLLGEISSALMSPTKPAVTAAASAAPKGRRQASETAWSARVPESSSSSAAAVTTSGSFGVSASFRETQRKEDGSKRTEAPPGELDALLDMLGTAGTVPSVVTAASGGAAAGSGVSGSVDDVPPSGPAAYTPSFSSSTKYVVQARHSVVAVYSVLQLLIVF